MRILSKKKEFLPYNRNNIQTELKKLPKGKVTGIDKSLFVVLIWWEEIYYHHKNL
jgi:hypothetical protein